MQKKYIMKTKQIIYIAVAVAFLALIIAVICQNSALNKKSAEITKLSTEKQLTIDSVKISDRNVHNTEMQALKDSLSTNAQLSKEKAKNSLKMANYYSNIVDKQQRIIDSLEFVNADCPEQLTATQNQNETLKKEVSELNVTCDELNNEAENYSKALLLSTKQLKNDSLNIADLSNDLLIMEQKYIYQQKVAEKANKRVKTAKLIGNIKTFIFTTIGIAGTIYLMK